MLELATGAVCAVTKKPESAPQGKPVKALSPNCRGGTFTGRRQTAATPFTAHMEKQPAIVQSRQCTPDGAGNGAGNVPRFSPGFVQVSRSASGPALAGRSFQEQSARQDRPGRTADRRRPPVPTSTPRRRRRASTRIPHSVAGERQRHCRPGRFLFPQGAFRRLRRRRPGRIIPVIRNAAKLHRALAPFPYYSTLYGIKSALPGRQHERGIPLSNSPHCRGPAPHTPRQRFAAAPRPAPGAGLAETPHAVSPASFRVTPAGASTARSSHAPAPPYHPAVRTRRHVTHRTTDPQLHARQDAGRSPSPPLGGAAPRPSPSLRSTSPVACAAQTHRLPQPAVCANVNTCRRRRASTYSALRRRHRRETTTRRNMPPDRRCLRGAYPFPPMPQSWPAPPV